MRRACARIFRPAAVCSGVEERFGYLSKNLALNTTPYCTHLFARRTLSFFIMNIAVISDSNAERTTIGTSRACPAAAKACAARTDDIVFVIRDTTMTRQPPFGSDACFSSSTARIIARSRWQNRSSDSSRSRTKPAASDASRRNASDACWIFSDTRSSSGSTAHKAHYAVVARLTKPLQARVAGARYHPWQGGIAFAEFSYEPLGWPGPRRFIAIRRPIPEEPSWQLHLFQMGKYLYQAIVTDLDLTPLHVWRFYNDRAEAELVIRELKEAYALGTIPSRRWEVNEAYFQLVLLAYNLLNWFRRLCVPAELSTGRCTPCATSSCSSRPSWYAPRASRPSNCPKASPISRRSGLRSSPSTGYAYETLFHARFRLIVRRPRNEGSARFRGPFRA